MRIKISHQTSYAYAPAARSVIQNLRLTPRSFDSQYVLRWRVAVDVDCFLRQSEDSLGNIVHAFSYQGAIDSFTIGLAREVATEGIRVNAVAPGLIATGLHAANGAPDRLERLMGTIPMQRPGTPLEVAEAVLWLLSPAASYTTGAILEIGGGR